MNASSTLMPVWHIYNASGQLVQVVPEASTRFQTLWKAAQSRYGTVFIVPELEIRAS